MSEVTIYHNPRCSKSRQTLALLEENGITPNIIEYLNNPPTSSDIETLLTLLDIDPRSLMRTKEQLYSDNNLSATDLSRAELIQAIVDHPILLERPIVVNNNRAAIGRPPENVLAII